MSDVDPEPQADKLLGSITEAEKPSKPMSDKEIERTRRLLRGDDYPSIVTLDPVKAYEELCRHARIWLATCDRLREERDDARKNLFVDDEVTHRSEIARVIIDEMPHGAKHFDARLLALIVLVETPSTVAEIRDALGVSQATASEIVDKGIKAGLVERVADWRDQRKHTVSLTPKGKRARKQRRGGE